MAIVKVDKLNYLSKAEPITKAPYNVISDTPSKEGEKNVGGLIGGIGYLGEKLAVGAVSSIEGIFDYAIGGIAELCGYDKFAERQFANDWFGDWYSHPDEWYKPGKGWKVAGDIAGGIGTSLPAIAVGLATGGAGNVAMGLATFATAGLGAAGNATKEAYRETGKLTGKEFAYGGITGAIEGGLETITNILGTGSGQVIKSVSKSLGRQVGISGLRDSTAKALVKSFGGEAFEEGVSAWVDGLVKRLTYDPKAKDASAGEILYQAFVGGMSGLVMGGAGTVFSGVKNANRGTKAIEDGRSDGVLGVAKEIIDFTSEKNVDDKKYQQVAATYNKLTESLKATNGEIKTFYQRRLLGELEADNVAAPMKALMIKEAANILADPEGTAQRLQDFKYTDLQGKAINYTAEQLKAGYDASNPKSISSALETNEALRTLAAMSASARLLIDAAAFENAMVNGTQYTTESDLARFRGVSDENRIKAVEKALGIENLRGAKAEEVNRAIDAFLQNEENAKKVEAVHRFRKLSETDTKPLSDNIMGSEADGYYRYNVNGSDVGISKQGDQYYVYDYKSGNPSTKAMTLDEVNNTLSTLRNSADATAQENAIGEITSQNGEADTVNDVAEDTNFAVPTLEKEKAVTTREMATENEVKEDKATTNPNKEEIATEGKKTSYDTIKTKDYYSNSRIYSYDFLTSQKDMEVLYIPDLDSILTNGKVDREKVIDKGKKNAKATPNSTLDKNDSVLVTNKYTKHKYRINNASIKHGLGGDVRYLNTNSRLGAIIGDIVENAIPINALKNKANDVDGTFAMVSYGISSENREFVAVVTVEARTGDAKSIEMIESVHSVSGRIKKGSVAGYTPQGEGLSPIPFTTSTISIAQLLEIVNSTHQSILSNDVLNHFNEKRKTEGRYSKDVLFSLSDKNAKAKPKTKKATKKVEKSAAEVKQLAKDNIKVYDKLSETSQGMVEAIIHRALYLGMSEGEALTLARVSAHSGIDIALDKNACRIMEKDENGKLRYIKDEKGNYKYADGAYVRSQNKIYINPEGSRSVSKVLIHELTHAIYRSPSGRLIIERGIKNLSEEERNRINKKYLKIAGGKVEILADEYNAHYVEGILDDERILNRICEGAPTLKNKILNFFKKAASDYSDDVSLSRKANKLLKRYQRMFDSFSERNIGNNALSSINSEKMHGTGDNGEAKEGVEGEEGRYAIVEGKVANAIEVAIREKGNLGVKYNQVRLSAFPESVSSMVSRASDGKIALENKFVAVNGDSIWHEYQRHQEESVEAGRRQLPLTPETMKEAIMAIYEPDVVESIFTTGENPTQRQSFVYAKKSPAGYYIVVEAVGGKSNPNVIPVMILRFNEAKWNDMMSAGLSLGEVLYENDTEMRDALDVEFNKRNRVIAAQFASTEAIANTPHSPRSTTIISQTAEKSNPSEEKNRKNLSTNSSTGVFALPDGDVDKYISDSRGSIVLEAETYKPSIKEIAFDGWTATQIQFTNAQAGIEKVFKRLGVKDGDSIVQRCRAASNIAQEMLGGHQYSADSVYKGEGLAQIYEPIKKQGKEAELDFASYLFHKHNQSRMTLEERSIEKNEQRKVQLTEKQTELAEVEKKIKDVEDSLSKTDKTNKAALDEELKGLKSEEKALNKVIKELESQIKAFKPLENKAVIGKHTENGETYTTTAEDDTVPFTAEESKAICERLEEQHPEFKESAEKLYKFIENLNQFRVDTGLISADTMSYLAELYPHYVPTYRTDTTKGIGAISGKHNLAVKSTIGRAKGSTKTLINPLVVISRQVMETVKAGHINQLANQLYEASLATGNTDYIEIVSKTKVSEEEVALLDPTEIRPKNNEITFFKDGERITIRVSKEVFAGFDAFSPSFGVGNPAVEGAAKVNKLFKRLVTSANPAFLLRNAIRDIQDAGINTKYGKTFLKNYVRAIKEITSDGELWRLYRANGGLSSSVFDFNTGVTGIQNKWGLTKAEGNILKKSLAKMENANLFVEQLPRLAEFISSVEAGNSYAQAILDSADITTNFGRAGKLSKELNRTIIPFLNPSIQGFSKVIRNITSIRSAKEAALFFTKVAIVGIAPAVINGLMYDDDEDYKNLRDTDKENNYLFKVGDTFIKIPRGRVASVIAGAYNRTAKQIKGEDADWKGYADNVIQQITPVSNFSRTIFSPFSDVKNNLTWYGTAIEGRQFETVAPKDRFDESTSSIAIAIGRVINYSPKKIHYLLDQYSGVIGDFILPATTAKAEKDFLSGNFTLDPAASNKLSTDFYELYDKAQYKKTAGDDIAKYQVQYLNKVKSAISDMYKQKSQIQNSDLSRAEKLQQTRVVQLLINEAYKTALQDFELYTKAFEATATIDEDYRYTEATRLMYGAEKALSDYNVDVYAKSKLLNLAGIDYENFYNYYFSTKDIESDKNKYGETISGSKRKKVVSEINKLKLKTEQKLILLASKGYSLSDAEKKRVLRYIMGLKIDKNQKAALAELCGFEVKNGKIIIKSAS